MFAYVFQEIYGFNKKHFEALFRSQKSDSFDATLLESINIKDQLDTVLIAAKRGGILDSNIHFNIKPSISIIELIDLSLICSRHNFPQEHLILEFVECGLTSLAILNYAKALGFSVALDDFGRGFSIDNLYSQFSYDYIKLDKVFLKSDIQRSIIESIVKNINEMYPSTQLIFEGVESKFDFDFVNSLNVVGVQGFYLSKPKHLNSNSIEAA